MSEHMFESWNEDEIEHLVEQLEARIDEVIKERDYIRGRYDEECRLYEEMRALLTSTLCEARQERIKYLEDKYFVEEMKK